MKKLVMITLLVLTVSVACGGYSTSVSKQSGKIDHGELCSRIEFVTIDEQLRTDLWLVFACNERPD